MREKTGVRSFKGHLVLECIRSFVICFDEAVLVGLITFMDQIACFLCVHFVQLKFNHVKQGRNVRFP